MLVQGTEEQRVDQHAVLEYAVDHADADAAPDSVRRSSWPVEHHDCNRSSYILAGADVHTNMPCAVGYVQVCLITRVSFYLETTDPELFLSLVRTLGLETESLADRRLRPERYQMTSLLEAVGGLRGADFVPGGNVGVCVVTGSRELEWPELVPVPFDLRLVCGMAAGRRAQVQRVRCHPDYRIRALAQVAYTVVAVSNRL